MKNIFILVLVILLSGCAATEVAKETIWINNEIKSGEVEENVRKADLSSTEEQVVTHALNSVAAFRGRYGAFIDDPSTLLTISPQNLVKDYQELRERFSEVEAIVVSNFNEYDGETQAKLSEYSLHAYALDEAVRRLLEEQKYRTAIKSALSYGFTTLQLISSLKP